MDTKTMPCVNILPAIRQGPLTFKLLRIRRWTFSDVWELLQRRLLRSVGQQRLEGNWHTGLRED